jgi:hypothetical protein
MTIPALPRGGLARLARRLERPYTTVSNWNRFGVPLKQRPRVSEAVEQLLKEYGEIDESMEVDEWLLKH